GNRPRRCGRRLPDRVARARRDDRRVPRPERRTRRPGQPRADRRLPRDLQRGRLAVARRRPRARHPQPVVVRPAGAAAVIVTTPPPPARVQVVAREFSLALSRPSIKAGTAIIELANFGEDAHDLRLQRVGGTKVYGWPVAQSGAVEDRTVRLVPG